MNPHQPTSVTHSVRSHPGHSPPRLSSGVREGQSGQNWRVINAPRPAYSLRRIGAVVPITLRRPACPRRPTESGPNTLTPPGRSPACDAEFRPERADVQEAR